MRLESRVWALQYLRMHILLAELKNKFFNEDYFAFDIDYYMLES